MKTTTKEHFLNYQHKNVNLGFDVTMNIFPFSCYHTFIMFQRKKILIKVRLIKSNIFVQRLAYFISITLHLLHWWSTTMTFTQFF